MKNYAITAPNNYSSIVENACFGLLLENQDGIILFANEAACHMFGYTPDEMKCKNRDDLFLKNGVRSSKTISNGFGKLQCCSELTGVKKNGVPFRCQLISKTFTEEDGRHHICTSLMDLSQQPSEKGDEEEIKNNEQRWRFALEGSNQGVWDWNMQTGELYFSPAWEKLFGFSFGEVKYTINFWEQRIHPDDRNAVYKDMEKHIGSDNALYDYTYRFQCKNGLYKWILSRGMIIEKTPGGVPVRMIGTHTDITEQKNTEENFKLLFYSNPLPSFIYDTTTLRFIEVNNAAIQHYGYTKHEFLSLTIKDIRPQEDVDILLETLEKIGISHYAPSRGDYRHKKKNGDPIYVSISSSALDYNGCQCRLVVVNDITARVKAEEELVRSNERFDSVMKATHDLIWDWDLETGFLYRDPEGLEKVYGVSDNNTIKHINDWMQRIHPQDYATVQKAVHAILQAKDHDTFEVEYRFKRDDGSYSYVYDRGILMRNSEGKPYRMIGAAQNITERKRLEADLLQKERDWQKAINQASIDTQEQERAEIGKELHDNVNQVLSTTKLYLDLALENPDLTKELTEKSTSNIIYVINEIRQLSRSLMNPSLDDLGLIDAVHDLVHNVNITQNLQAALVADAEIEKYLAPNQKLMLYRIVQEALNNAVKHAGATTVSITMKREEDVELIIHDDGIGFHPGKVKKGAGLKNIQNRVYLTDGALTIESEPYKGCKLKIKFPVNKSTNHPI